MVGSKENIKGGNGVIPIIIVNWNGLSDTIECMESVLNTIHDNYHIYLIDNGSENNEGEQLEELYKSRVSVSISLYPKNLGFTGAHLKIWHDLFRDDTNIEYIVLLNNDTTVDPNWLLELLRVAKSKECGMVSAKMLKYDDNSQVDNLGHKYLNTGEILPLGHGESANQYLEPKQNFGACAGGALYSANMLRDIGFFDSSFFTGYEDAELGLRAKVYGYHSWFAPDSLIYHKGGRSISKIFNASYATSIQYSILYSYFKNVAFFDILLALPFIILKYVAITLISLLSLRINIVKLIIRAVGKLIYNIPALLLYRLRTLGDRRRILTFQSTFFLKYYSFRLYELVIKNDRSALDIYNNSTKVKKKVLIIADALDNQNAGVHFYVKSVVNKLGLSKDLKNSYYLLRTSNKRSRAIKEIDSIYLPQFLDKIPGLKTLKVFLIVPLVAFYKGFDAVFEPSHFGPFNLPSFIKRITFIHDLTPILYPEFHQINGWLLHKLFLKQILRKTDAVVVNSKHTLSDVVNYYQFTKDKIYLNYLGVREIKVGKTDDFPLYSNYFLFVGTVEPRKNILTLLKAFELFSETNPRYQLHLVGSKGWKCKDIYKAINESKFSGNIVVHGYVEDSVLDNLYANCTAFVYPSIYEGFGLPVIEALSRGCVCIVSNNSSLAELFSTCSFMFETYDYYQLCDYMIEIATKDLSDKRVEFESNFKKLSLNCNWDSHVKVLDRLIYKL